MCLITSNYYHKKDKFNNVKCFVAEEDILVYKCLDCINREFRTPFQYMPIIFKRGKYVYNKVSMKKKAFCNKIDVCNKMDEGAYIGSGIHAYRTMSRAFAVSKSFYEFDGTYMHYAVIPKGSNFYIGNNVDIVSDNLIVYRDKKYFDKDYENIIDISDYILKYIKAE